MKAQVSALTDGELEGEDIATSLAELRRSQELRTIWSDSHLIGAALRGEKELAVDVTARVMAALELEPTVLAPATRRRLDWHRPALAMAASAAGVAMVAWLALGSASAPVVLPQAKAVAPSRVAQVAAPRMQEYLVAHQAYAPGGDIVGGARHIRTVSESSGGRGE